MALINIFQRLWDEFDGTELDLLMWEPSQGVNHGITVANGVAQLSMAAAENSYTMLQSALFHDIEYSRFFAEVIPPTTSGTMYVIMELYIDTNNYIRMSLEGASTLRMRFRDEGVNSDTTLTYNSTTHRWWRIREADNILFFDTSSDGVAWTNRRTVAHEMSGLTNMKARFIAGHTTGTITGTSTIVDNVNIIPGVRIFRDDMQVAGNAEIGNMAFGTIDITPTPNANTSLAVNSYNLAGSGDVMAFTTAFSSVPGSFIWGTSANSVTATGMDVVIYRTNSTVTTVYWMVYRNRE